MRYLNFPKYLFKYIVPAIVLTKNNKERPLLNEC